MKPLQTFQNAQEYFNHGGFAFHFSIPEGTDQRYYVKRIREYAKEAGLHWRVARNDRPGDKRAWIIKQKGA